MKKISFLLLFVLLQSAVTFAQSAWVTQKIDEKLSVKFPETPSKVIKKGSESYVNKGKDSVQYSAIVLDYKVLANLDSATLASMKDTQQFADQIRGGMVTQKPNYTFEVAKIGKWNTFTNYSFSGIDNTNKSRLSIQMILIGSKMYVLSCLVPDKLITKNDERFLSSAELSR